jgi:hypothetical protein
MPVFELPAQRAIQRSGTCLEHEVRSPLRPAHLLAFAKALANHCIEGAFDEACCHALTISSPFSVVWDHPSVVDNVGLELIGSLTKAFDAGVLGFNIVSDKASDYQPRYRQRRCDNQLIWNLSSAVLFDNPRTAMPFLQWLEPGQ